MNGGENINRYNQMDMWMRICEGNNRMGTNGIGSMVWNRKDNGFSLGYFTFVIYICVCVYICIYITQNVNPDVNYGL